MNIRDGEGFDRWCGMVNMSLAQRHGLALDYNAHSINIESTLLALYHISLDDWDAADELAEHHQDLTTLHECSWQA